MIYHKPLIIAALAIVSAPTFAQSPTTNWTSAVVENYLNENKGATVHALTNLEDNSRWYSTVRIKSGYSHEQDHDNAYLQAHLRLRGKTMLTDNLGIIGDFWLKAVEKWSRVDGKTVDRFENIDDVVDWEQFRFGLEHDTFGALMYGKHSATWSIFALDMSSEGILDSQGDAGQKSWGKLLYKKHFNNNLFLSGTYDTDSTIYGVDFGFQTADLYAYAPNSMGIYASIHNGQPSLFHGSKPIMGNVNLSGDSSNSDTPLARADESLHTYAISGYKFWDMDYRFVGQLAYSEMADGETANNILRNGGLTEGGLGFSASAGIAKLPAGGSGVVPTLYVSHDIFGASITPQLEFWHGKPTVRSWLSYSIHEGTENVIKAEFQWDF